MVVVNLGPVSPVNSERPERTFTDNISYHGARVHSATSWELGNQVEITPVKGEQPMRGNVIYCERQAEDRFFIGLQFQSQIPWSVLQRFNGMFVMEAFYATCHF